MEKWESLCPGGLRFPFEPGQMPGTDTFLLGSFPKLKPGARVCDLGCGAGLLSLLLLQRQPALRVAGVELRAEAAALARRAAAENDLRDRLDIREADLRTLRGILPAGSFDLCVANPPYFPVGAGGDPADAARRAARSEATCTLDELCRAAAGLLRWGGAFCLVHRPERLVDLLCALRQNGLEPKRLRFVEVRAGAAPSLVLAEGRRGGKPGLAAEPPLILTGEDGEPTPESEQAYFRTKENAL